MKFTYLFIFGLILMLSCNRRITSTNEFFSVKECYYESWMAGKTEKGTTVTFILTDVKAGIRFDSLVFNKNQVPLTQTESKNTVSLVGTIPAYGSKLDATITNTNKANQLIYSQNNNKFSYPFDSISRRKMKYYK